MTVSPPVRSAGWAGRPPHPHGAPNMRVAVGDGRSTGRSASRWVVAVEILHVLGLDEGDVKTVVSDLHPGERQVASLVGHGFLPVRWLSLSGQAAVRPALRVNDCAAAVAMIPKWSNANPIPSASCTGIHAASAASSSATGVTIWSSSA